MTPLATRSVTNGRLRIEVELFKLSYLRNYAVYFIETCLVNVK